MEMLCPERLAQSQLAVLPLAVVHEADHVRSSMEDVLSLFGHTSCMSFG